MNPLNGRCNCGAISIVVGERPEYLNQCNCSLCSASGATWGYFTADQTQVVGEASQYQRADLDNPRVLKHFCKSCGDTTHCTALDKNMADWIAINMRLIPVKDLVGTEIRFPDGRNWARTEAYGFRRDPITLVTENLVMAWDDF